MNPIEYDFPFVIRHEYDIDVFEILDNFRNRIEEYNNVSKQKRDPKDLDVLEAAFVKSIEVDFGIDLTENQKYRNYIISSSNKFYTIFLGLKVLTIDPYKIEPLLSYQSVLFLGNRDAPKDNFLGLVEFEMYRNVKQQALLGDSLRLEKIVNWLERNRFFLMNKAYNEEIPQLLNFKVVDMDPDFANIMQEKLKAYIPIEHHPNIFILFFKGEIPSPLCFIGQTNQLTELFKRLRYNSKINVATIDALANWITKNFVVKNKLEKIENIKTTTVLQILKKSTAEPPKGKRILEDVAEFLLPNQRRKDKEIPKK